MCLLFVDSKFPNNFSFLDFLVEFSQHWVVSLLSPLQLSTPDDGPLRNRYHPKCTNGTTSFSHFLHFTKTQGKISFLLSCPNGWVMGISTDSDMLADPDIIRQVTIAQYIPQKTSVLRNMILFTKGRKIQAKSDFLIYAPHLILIRRMTIAQ